MIGNKVTDDLTVSPQIDVHDIKTIASAGFRSILCNRPDDEEPGQPAFAAIEAAAREHGLTIGYQPVISGQLTDDDIDRFKAMIESLPSPVFAYCRSGTRCIVLWAHAETARRPIQDVLALARNAGYNLSST